MSNPDVLLMSRLMPRVMERLERQFTVHRYWEAADPHDLIDRLAPHLRAIAASAGGPQVDAAFIDRFHKLEIIANFGVGYDNVDATRAAERGIIVTNTPGVLDDEVADLTLGLLLSTIRRLPQADRFVREGHWLKGPFPLSATLRGRKAGIIGLGRIGKAIARRLEAFGIELAYAGRNRQQGVNYPYHATAVELAREVDILIAITPGGPETRHLIDAQVLKALGPEGVVINVARGSVVDEAALIAALKDGTIAAAGLDVYEDEPHVPQGLIELDNVVLLPHLGSASVHTREAMGNLVVDNLEAWFADRGALTPVPETPWPA